ncbi:MAG: hypothetical protein OHK0022_42450 [Roseiflexaceae bacterium]
MSSEESHPAHQVIYLPPERPGNLAVLATLLARIAWRVAHEACVVSSSPEVLPPHEEPVPQSVCEDK